MKLFRLVLAVLLLTAASASAQTTTVEVNQPFRAVFTHDGVNTTGYRVFVDNVQVGPDAPASALTAGSVSLAVPSGVSMAGTHTLQAAAFNASGETKSAALTFTVTDPPPPPPPTEPSVPTIDITVTVAARPDGTLELTAVRVGGVLVP
jgi:hypothetical protein